MQDIDIMDRSFEIYHNSEGRRNLFSNFESEDVAEGKDKPKGGKDKPTRTPIDPEKLSETLATLGATAGSIAGTVQAFKDPNKSTSRKAKKETKRSLVQVCGRKPLFSKAKKSTYQKCIADYNLKIASAPITPTERDEEIVEPTPNKNKMIYIGLGVLAVVVVGYFVLKGKKAI
jgi:hypothetical protein